VVSQKTKTTKPKVWSSAETMMVLHVILHAIKNCRRLDEEPDLKSHLWKSIEEVLKSIRDYEVINNTFPGDHTACLMTHAIPILIQANQVFPSKSKVIL
jgi:hypothetical protein